MKNTNNFFKRYSRIRGFNSACNLVLDSELEKAQNVLSGLLSKNPNGVSTRLLLADTYLFQRKYKDAMLEYKATALEIGKNEEISENDRYFLSAYINFRKLAIGHSSGYQEFPEWQSVARQINKLPATKRLKRCFTLPIGTTKNSKQ